MVQASWSIPARAVGLVAVLAAVGPAASFAQSVPPSSSLDVPTDAFHSTGIDALLFPTTPLVAPPLDTGEDIIIAGCTVSSVKLAKNAYPSSCAALPGIAMPMGLPHMVCRWAWDGKPGEDVKLLDLAAQVSAILGSIPPSRM